MTTEPLPPADPRLGRLIQFDDRSRGFPVTAIIKPRVPRSYTWAPGRLVLDQGQEGACVGFSIAHDLSARPVRIQRVGYGLAMMLYHGAQKIDDWPGEESGTSVLAGMKIAKQIGYYGEYRWAFSEADLALAIGYKGPAILGVPWYEGMMSPDEKGYLHLDGDLVGGHAIMCNGIDIRRGRYLVHNSWGVGWGAGGDAYITRSDMRLLLSSNGEACIPTQRLIPVRG